MSKPIYVSDGVATICIQGLRMVTKSDSRYASRGGRDAYYLELEYKGLSKKIEYASQEARDKIYDDIALLLTPSAADCATCGASLTSGTTPKNGKQNCPSCGASR